MDFIDEVVGGDVFPVDDHVVDEVELQKSNNLPVQGLEQLSILLLRVFRL